MQSFSIMVSTVGYTARARSSRLTLYAPESDEVAFSLSLSRLATFISITLRGMRQSQLLDEKLV